MRDGEAALKAFYLERPAAVCPVRRWISPMRRLVCSCLTLAVQAEVGACLPRMAEPEPGRWAPMRVPLVGGHPRRLAHLHPARERGRVRRRRGLACLRPVS